MRIYYIGTGALKRQENFNRGIYFFETGERNASPALEREVQRVIRLEMGRRLFSGKGYSTAFHARDAPWRRRGPAFWAL
jgi:hypothetical protein